MEKINEKANPSELQVLLIDLDDTLYSSDSGVWEMIRTRMQKYMLEEMNISPDEVPVLRNRLWRQYGTTLRGLKAEFEVDEEDFLAYVHDVPMEEHIIVDTELRNMLQALPQRKFVFTNSHYAHANRVTGLLGVRDQFEGIIDIYAMMPYCKPQVEAFQIALDIVQDRPEHCLLVDDSPDNLSTAKALGMTTISIGAHHHEASPHIESIHHLKAFLPES